MNRRSGFALVIALSLMAFILLMLVSLTSLVRVEARSAAQALEQLAARQNALLGLQVAVGELQKHAGPDERVTATAGLLDPNEDSSVIEDSFFGSYAGVNHPHLTGIWRAGDADEFPDDLPWDSQFDPHPVRGKDGSNPKGRAAWITPENVGLSPEDPNYWTPTDAAYPLPADDERFVWLFLHPRNPATADFPDDPDDPDDPRRVIARKSEIEGGHYSFFVADESVKTSLGGYDPYRDDGDNATLPFNLVAQRSAPEKMEGLEPFVEGNEVEWRKLASPFTAALLTDGDTAEFRKALTARSHDWTATSFGLQTDTASGGLKYDLSLAFDLPDDVFERDPFFSDTKFEISDEPSALGRPLESGTYTSEANVEVPYSHLLYSPADVPSLPSDRPSAFRGPTWQLLRDYARSYLPVSANVLGYQSESGGKRVYRARIWGFGKAGFDTTDREQINERSRSAWRTNARATWKANGWNSDYYRSDINAEGRGVRDRATRGHLAPVMINWSQRWGVVADTVTENGESKKQISFIMQPSVVLWNPYNVVLEVDAMATEYRPDSGHEFVVETELEEWPADEFANDPAFQGPFYRKNQEVLHEGTIYRRDVDYSQTDASDEPGVSGKWTELVSASGRSAVGSTWGIGAVANWQQIMPGEEKQSRTVLLSKTTAESINPGDSTFSTFEPIRFEPGEVKFFGLPSAGRVNVNDLPDGGDRTVFILGEGLFNPSGGIVYDRIRTDATDGSEGLFGGEDAKLLVPNGKDVRVSLAAWGSNGRQGSVGGQSLRDFYGNPGGNYRDWNMTTGNDGLSLGIRLGKHTPHNGDAADWDDGNREFTGMTSSNGFDIKHNFNSEYQWRNIPPERERSMVVNRTLAGNLSSTPTLLGQFDYYMKSGEDADVWPAQVLVNSNPRVSVNFDFGRGPFRYSSAHAHLEWLNRKDGNFNSAPIDFDSSTARAYYGPSTSGGAGESFVHLYDIPAAPLLSLGRFRHASLDVSGASPAYMVGSSEASPEVGYENFLRHNSNEHGDPMSYDFAWLANEALFDGFFFSSLTPRFGRDGSADADQIEEWLEGTRTLPNSRVRAYPEPEFTNPFDASTLEADDGYRKSAAALLVEGTFNVNSTSVEAWKAVLASLDGSTVPLLQNGAFSTDSDVKNALPRALLALGPSTDAWKGYRSLSDDQLETLAEEIVRQVKLRGPFLSLADFVNRRLVGRNDSDEGGRNIGETGAKGALQAAIDRTTLNQNPEYSEIDVVRINQLPADRRIFPDLITGTGEGDKMMAHAAGYLTQGDILQAVAPILSARSDTFRIRFYGDKVDPVSGARAEAYGEAIIQRTIEYVDPEDDPDASPYVGSNGMPQSDLERVWPAALREGAEVELDDLRYDGRSNIRETVESNLTATNRSFGRRFEILSIRWLEPNEI